MAEAEENRQQPPPQQQQQQCGPRQPRNPKCLVHQHSRRNCPENCEIRQWLPESKHTQLAQAIAVFGINAILDRVNKAGEEERDSAIQGIIFSARCWAEFPSQGPKKAYDDLQEELNRARNQVNMLIRTVHAQRAEQSRENSYDLQTVFAGSGLASNPIPQNQAPQQNPNNLQFEFPNLTQQQQRIEIDPNVMGGFQDQNQIVVGQSSGFNPVAGGWESQNEPFVDLRSGFVSNPLGNETGEGLEQFLSSFGKGSSANNLSGNSRTGFGSNFPPGQG